MNIKKELTHKRKGKVLLNISILKKKYHISRKHLILPLIFIIFFLVNRKFFVFGLLTVLSGAFSFYHDKYNRTPIDFKLPLFLGIFITRYFGFGYTFVFFILSDIIPTLVAGGDIEGASLLYIGWYFIVNSIVLLFPGTNIITLGMILVVVETLGSVFITRMRGFPGIVALASSFLSMVARIGYFMTLGGLMNLLFTNLF